MCLFNRYCLLIFLAIFFVANASAQNNIVKAEIKLIKNDEYVTVQAMATNDSEINLDANYLLFSAKQDKNNNLSKNEQKGFFTLESFQTKSLSEIKLNFKENDLLKIYLFIKDNKNQKLISKDSLWLGNFSKNKTSQNKPRKRRVQEENLRKNLSTGLVIEETRTRVGKDFYDAFFIAYQQIPNKYPFIIKITELPTMGRNTQIEVFANDKKIRTFISNPKLEFIDTQVDQTLRLLQRHNRRMNFLKNE